MKLRKLIPKVERTSECICLAYSWPSGEEDVQVRVQYSLEYLCPNFPLESPRDSHCGSPAPKPYGGLGPRCQISKTFDPEVALALNGFEGPYRCIR